MGAQWQSHLDHVERVAGVALLYDRLPAAKHHDLHHLCRRHRARTANKQAQPRTTLQTGPDTAANFDVRTAGRSGHGCSRDGLRFESQR
eukprot:6346777-Prymnesium_polylepis.1